MLRRPLARMRVDALIGPLMRVSLTHAATISALLVASCLTACSSDTSESQGLNKVSQNISALSQQVNDLSQQVDALSQKIDGISQRQSIYDNATPTFRTDISGAQQQIQDLRSIIKQMKPIVENICFKEQQMGMLVIRPCRPVNPSE